MKKFLIITILFLTIISLNAQEQSADQNILPQLTIEQRVDRAVMNSLSYMIMGIAYAKNSGKSTEDFARFCAQLALPAYLEMKGKNPIAVVKAISRVHQADPAFRIEILNASESSVEARMTLYGLNYLKFFNDFGGVTISECYEYYNKFMQEFSQLLDFNYKYDVVEDWIVFTLTIKE
ncbi:hypothetical protein JW964_13560 [candidate division KSB1 bacterium]|nr:hypothetical protein [candidate division KSB1 bacterium]